MVYEEIYLQLFLITLGMVAFSLILNKLLGFKPENMVDIRDKALNLKERLENAQALGDMRLMQELQYETVQLMKQMLKKQIVPLCLRCFIFIGILTVIGIIYGAYGFGSQFFFGLGWPFYYFFLTLGLSLVIFGIKRYYFKLTGKQNKRTNFLREITQVLNLGSLRSGAGTVYQLPSQMSASQQQPPVATDSWKDRIQQTVEPDNKPKEEED
jgi:hypothetical protein